ncbi:MAG: hypothetical protein M3Q16_12605 [Pseudomonadota bacterium]|nr:hypothetical protein [Pseudomonadota bacterium]
MKILIKNSRDLLLAIAVMLGLCAGTGAYAQEPADKNKPSSQPGKKEGQMTVEVPVIVMVPVQVSSDLAMGKGCWVKLYDDEGYRGDSLMLVGPINLAQMIGPFGFNWEDKVRSLETGPKANLTIYDNRNFRDQDNFIGAAKKVPDMSKKMGFLDNFRSMMLSCI